MQLRIQRTLSALTLAFASMGSAVAQTWSDDFESYAVGSALETQGGWEGWDGVNTTFTVVTAAQAHSPTRSIQPNPGSDTVHQFTPPTSGAWEFLGYVYVPSTFTSQLDYMIMNSYQHGGPYEWGSWIEFSGTAGTVTCNCGGFASNVVPIPFDRWVEVRQVIDLDIDYAEIYFDGQLFASYTWTSGYSGSTGHLVGSIQAIDLYATGNGSGMYVDDLSLSELAGPIGSAYCTPAVANSTGSPAEISAVGFTDVARNNVTLEVTQLPQGAFGYFITSQTQGFTANPSGSQGHLCLAGSIGRYVGPGQIMNSGTSGTLTLPIDLTRTPQPGGLVNVVAGQTWNFQAWYRDLVGGVPTSNFTDGLSITFI